MFDKFFGGAFFGGSFFSVVVAAASDFIIRARRLGRR
jgi:hypothetical protein